MSATRVSEAEACRWLGRRVVLVAADRATTAGRLRHVSSRSAFLIPDTPDSERPDGTVRAIRLTSIVRIEPADYEETGS